MMAAIQGRKAEFWLAEGAGSALTKQACEAVGISTTVFHVTDPAKRYLDPATTVLVYCGAGETLQTSGYHIAGGCQIHFDSAPSAPVKLTGAYLTPAEITLVTGYSLTLESEVYETSSLGGSARTYQGSGILAWSGSFDRFYEDDAWGARMSANATKLLGRFFTDQPSGYCWTGWVIPGSWSHANPSDGLETEAFSFTGEGEPVYSIDET
jgi:hypothetical protein